MKPRRKSWYFRKHGIDPEKSKDNKRKKEMYKKMIKDLSERKDESLQN